MVFFLPSLMIRKGSFMEPSRVMRKPVLEVTDTKRTVQPHKMTIEA